MSLQHAAQHLASHGRGPDTVLVHMTKGEVNSLNDLAMAHGGHLTVNPKTGLPEAGFLSSILPSVIGFGLNAAFPGLGQIGSGLITGALGMALNPGGGLMGGLMAGMGGYGGAGLGDALAKSGMEQATQQELAKNQAFQTQQALGQQQTQQLGQSYLNASNPTFMGPNMSPEIVAQNTQMFNQPAADIIQNTKDNVLASSGFGSPDYATSTAGNRMGTALEGVKGLGNEAGRSEFMNNIGGGMGLAKTGLMAAAPLLAEKKDAPPEMKTDSDPGQQYKYAANPVNPTPASDQYGRENKYFNPTYTNAAAGGMMASGGISDAAYNLGGYSDGGRLLRGPGDGVSDSIPATIGHKQPARLADGEFVVPARIVSEIGNGSTEAGARKLYAMMDRIQSARSKTVGKGKIAKNSRAEQYLPA